MTQSDRGHWRGYSDSGSWVVAIGQLLLDNRSKSCEELSRELNLPISPRAAPSPFLQTTGRCSTVPDRPLSDTCWDHMNLRPSCLVAPSSAQAWNERISAWLVQGRQSSRANPDWQIRIDGAHVLPYSGIPEPSSVATLQGSKGGKTEGKKTLGPFPLLTGTVALLSGMCFTSWAST